MNDVVEFMRAYPNINFRYLIFPHKGAPMSSGANSLQFTPEVIGPMVEAGKQDGKRAVERGEGKGFELLKKWHSNEDGLAEEFEHFEDLLYAIDNNL